MKHYCSRKILLISHQLSRTGAPIALLNVARLLREEGNVLTLISLEDGPLRDEFESMGANVSIETDILKRWEEFIPFFEGFDLVFCNTIVTFEAIHVLNFTNVPTVWWIHEPKEYFDMVSDVLPDFSKLKENIHIWAVNESNRAYIKDTYHRKTVLIPLYIPDKKTDDELSQRDKVRFLCVGMYCYTKGQDLLIEALRNLDDDVISRVEIAFCGDEEHSDETYLSQVKQAEENLPIKRIGSLSQEDLHDAMRKSDYLICPSRMESFSMVTAEAMMLGLPVLLSDGCGILNVMEDYPDVFPKENVDAIAESICRAVQLRTDENLYLEKKNAVRRIYEDVFSRERFREKLFGTLESYMPKKRLVFLTGNYDVLDIFTLRLEKAFEEMGYEVFDFDCSDLKKSMPKFGTFLKEGPANATFTFNFYSTFMELADKKVVWEQYSIPTITYLMDHPFCFDENLQKLKENSIVLCPDKNHMNYVTRFYPNVPVCGFLGHGGIEKHLNKKSMKDRKIEVLYAGGISAPNVEKIRPDYSKYDFDARLIGDETFAYLCEHPNETTEDILEEMLKVHGISMSDEELRTFIFDMHYVDLQIVSYFREKTVRSLAEAGVPVTLYGFGWENFDWIQTLNVDYRGRVSAFEIIDLMADAKIVLSTMTWFKDGTHDRVFNGQLQGAFAITDTSKYMKEEFTGLYPDEVNISEKEDAAEVGFFELEEIHKLPQMIKALLIDDERLEALAHRGYEKAVAAHSWEERAKELDRDLLLYL